MLHCLIEFPAGDPGRAAEDDARTSSPKCWWETSTEFLAPDFDLRPSSGGSLRSEPAGAKALFFCSCNSAMSYSGFSYFCLL